ncbi:MAG: cysteine desulfurase [Planctomycetes bacterium]|nr:cysteine desulfurase [Planctomycetota bacterium]
MPAQQQIYLDYNASTPVAPEVLDAMAPYANRYYGNPHTRHWAGKPAGEAVERARRQVAETIGCDADELFFTSGASEANNWAIKGVYFANRRRGGHFVTTQIEHPSILQPLAWLEKTFGATVTRVAVDRTGRVDAREFAAALTPQTILACVMHANNEVGTIQPVREIAAAARARNVPILCDAAQSLGKIPVSVGELGVDLLSIAGHKLYAPKGVGALYVRRDAVKIDPLIHGAGQERGLRGGTENAEFIVGLGAACEIARREDMARLRELRDYFWQQLRARFGQRVAMHGHENERLPNTLNVGFRDVVSAELLDKLSDIAASPGSACHYGDVKMSAVLSAMQVDPATGRGAIRWSLGRSTTRAQIDAVVERLAAAMAHKSA